MFAWQAVVLSAFVAMFIAGFLYLSLAGHRVDVNSQDLCKEWIITTVRALEVSTGAKHLPVNATPHTTLTTVDSDPREILNQWQNEQLGRALK